MKIKAIIFDCDGTMFDTETLSIKAFTQVADSINFKLPDDFFAQILGTTKVHIVKYLQEYKEFLKVYDNVYLNWQKLIVEACKHPDSLNKKGLMELLDYLTANNYKLAIASSSPIKHVEALINHMSKCYSFDAIISGDMVQNSKPAPDIFLKASERLNVKPEECIVIEDSYNGILASKNANMSNIYIEDKIKFDADKYTKVDKECKDLKEVITYLKEIN